MRGPMLEPCRGGCLRVDGGHTILSTASLGPCIMAAVAASGQEEAVRLKLPHGGSVHPRGPGRDFTLEMRKELEAGSPGGRAVQGRDGPQRCVCGA